MKSAAKLFLMATILCLGLAIGVRAQDETPPAAGGAADKPARPRRSGSAQAEPIAYDRVITADAKTQHGIFDVHQIKDTYFYEIPTSQLNKDFLWVTLIAKTTLGVGYGGQDAGNHVVRWERHGNNVFLRSVSYEIVADESLPIASAVRAANDDAILMSFPIRAFGKNEAPVIDVTRLYATEVPEFSARARCVPAVLTRLVPTSIAFAPSPKISKSKPRRPTRILPITPPHPEQRAGPRPRRTRRGRNARK